MAKTVLGRDVLEMALVGYEAEKARVATAIATIWAQLGQPGPKAGSEGSAPAPHKRTLSAAVRKRMAAAQRKRWAAYRKEKAAPKPKRHLSEAARKAMAAGGRRRWTAHRKGGRPHSRAAAPEGRHPVASGWPTVRPRCQPRPVLPSRATGASQCRTCAAGAVRRTTTDKGD